MKAYNLNFFSKFMKLPAPTFSILYQLDIVYLLAPGTCGGYLKSVIIKLISRTDIWRISCQIAQRWIPQYLIDEYTSSI